MRLIFLNRLNEVASFGVDSVVGFGELLDVLELFDVGSVDPMLDMRKVQFLVIELGDDGGFHG